MTYGDGLIAGRLFSDNGDDSNAPALANIEGIGSSLLESRLWDTFTGIQTISTTRGLQVANANGIPILHIDQSNINALLPTIFLQTIPGEAASKIYLLPPILIKLPKRTST